jgi:hypothetical protein
MLNFDILHHLEVLMRSLLALCFSCAAFTLCAEEELDLDKLPYFNKSLPQQEQVVKSEQPKADAQPIKPPPMPQTPEMPNKKDQTPEKKPDKKDNQPEKKPEKKSTTSAKPKPILNPSKKPESKKLEKQAPVEKKKEKDSSRFGKKYSVED